MMTWRKMNLYAPLLAAALLAGMGVQHWRQPTPADAAPFFARVRDAAAHVPQRIGAWTGVDVPMPPAAAQLLKPNVLLARQYTNADTHETATFVLVHCKDARDMAGHYPPNCYPAHGWNQQSATPRDWHIHGRAIHGMEYAFRYAGAMGGRRMIVEDFMVMPDGQTLRHIAGVRRAAADYTRHFFGAGQIQLVMDASIAPARRTAIFHEIIGANLPLIEALGSGVHGQ